MKSLISATCLYPCFLSPLALLRIWHPWIYLVLYKHPEKFDVAYKTKYMKHRKCVSFPSPLFLTSVCLSINHVSLSSVQFFGREWVARSTRIYWWVGKAGPSWCPIKSTKEIARGSWMPHQLGHSEYSKELNWGVAMDNWALHLTCGVECRFQQIEGVARGNGPSCIVAANICAPQ